MIKVIELTDAQRLQLEEGFHKGKSHAFRMRCRAILLKSKGLTSRAVGAQTEMTHISVNSWVKRFETEGISGLATRPGRGRKPIMDCSDEEIVRKAFLVLQILSVDSPHKSVSQISSCNGTRRTAGHVHPEVRT